MDVVMSQMDYLGGVPLHHALGVSMVLFIIGLVGVSMRKNLLFILMSLEVMMNAAAFAFVTAGAKFGVADGQVMFIFILTLAAAEAAIGLAILLQFYHRYQTLDVRLLNGLGEQKSVGAVKETK